MKSSASVIMVMSLICAFIVLIHTASTEKERFKWKNGEITTHTNISQTILNSNDGFSQFISKTNIYNTVIERN